MKAERRRCPWSEGDPLYIEYHDSEWGVPLHDDRQLFEFLILEGAQAGLSWLTILRKREGYRRAFDGFVPERVAKYGAREVRRLLADASIVRNRQKIASSIALATARSQSGVESLDDRTRRASRARARERAEAASRPDCLRLRESRLLSLRLPAERLRFDRRDEGMQSPLPALLLLRAG